MNKQSGSDQKDLVGIANNVYNHIFTKENMVKFSHEYYLQSKNCPLNIEHSDLWSKLTNWQPNIGDLFSVY